MIQRSQHTCVILVGGHADGGVFPDLRNQIFFQGSLDPGLHVSFLLHDSAAEDDSLRVDHKTDVGNSHAEKVCQSLQFLLADGIAGLRRLKDAETIPHLCLFPLSHAANQCTCSRLILESAGGQMHIAHLTGAV